MGETTVEAATRTRAVSGQRASSVARRIMAIDEIGVIGALLAICVFLTLASDKFLTTTNFINVSRQASWFGSWPSGWSSSSRWGISTFRLGRS